MTTHDVCWASGIHYGTVLRHLRQGTLKGRQTDTGRWIVDVEDFKIWMHAVVYPSKAFITRLPEWTGKWLHENNVR